MHRRVAPLPAAVLIVGLLAGCGGGESTSPSSAARSAEAAATSAVPGLPSGGTGLPGLPGDEALTPPPPDPAARDYQAVLGGLPEGALAGDIQLNVSGLVGFAEPATGRCLTGGTAPTLEVDLSDGSVLRIDATRTGITTSLRAPGVEAGHTLTDVELTPGPRIVLAGDLLTEGTTEPSGSLRLEFTCA